MNLLFNILLFILMIWLGLFLYTQIGTFLYLVETYDYTYKDLDKIMKHFPDWNIHLPFQSINLSTPMQWIRTFLYVLLIAIVLALIVGTGKFSDKRKSKYQKESYGHIQSRLERKRGLNRIQYTATKRFNVYGGKGKITRHTLRCFLEWIFRPILIIENKIATEYNWSIRYRWNLQKARMYIPDERMIENLINIRRELNNARNDD